MSHSRRFALLSLLLIGSASAQQKIILKAADIQPEHYPTVAGLKYMSDYLKRVTNGRIELQVFAGGQLGDERSTIEQTKLGVIDLVRVSSAPVAQFYAQVGVYNMPFLFRDSSHMWKVLNGSVGKEILSGLNGAGFIGLAYYDSGTRNFYTTKKAIKSVADMKGLRIRTQQNQVVLDMMEALGAKPVPMAIGEVYSALQTGAIDGAENNFPSYGAAGFRHFEVAKNYSLTAHSAVPELVLMSKTSWDRLSKTDQMYIQKAALASVDVQKKAWKTLSDQSKNQVKKDGAKVHTVNVSEFQKAMAPVYTKYKKDYGDLIDRILDVK